MTELNQRIALAKLRGMEGPWKETCLFLMESPRKIEIVNPQNQHLPELTLDELHEAEKCLDNRHGAEWIANLWKIRDGHEHNTLFDLFVRTTGRWKECE